MNNIKEYASKEYVKEYVNENLENINIETDNTLALEGTPADAKATGDALALKANSSDIPTKVSELENDSKYALSSDIPTNLSDLTDDTTHRLVTDIEKSTWNAKADVDDIPTKVSELENDSKYLTSVPVTSVNNKTGAIELNANDVNADASGTASSLLSTHNTATDSHNDIRELINGLTTRINTIADSDDTTLDQLSEIVAYIKSNKTLIEEVTNKKVNVDDIINNLTTNVSNKPLSAAQGVVLKNLIDSITIPTNLSELEDDSGHRLVTDSEKSTWNAKADLDEIPTNLSDLTDDTTHRLVTDTEKSTWNAKANTSDIPTKVSELENDSKYLTSSDLPTNLSDLTDDSGHRLVTDSEKSTWNNKANIDEIPTNLSELEDDSGHRLVTDSEKSTWNAKADIDDIPTKVSELENDSRYLTSVPVTSVNNKTGAITLKASDVNADASGTASSLLSTHNTATDSHNDIRTSISNQKHSASDITSGVLSIERGGTGCSSITDTKYTTARYRASSLHSSETTPTTNGVICWVYE